MFELKWTFLEYDLPAVMHGMDSKIILFLHGNVYTIPGLSSIEMTVLETNIISCDGQSAQSEIRLKQYSNSTVTVETLVKQKWNIPELKEI